MSKGFFTNKTSKLSETDVLNIIGKAKNNWDSITYYLMNVLKLKGDLKFYRVNYGWAFRYNKSDKSVVALYPDQDCFTVQIILNQNQVEFAVSGNLNFRIVRIIREKEYTHEGKWIYLMVDKDTEIKNILKLADIRIK